MRSTMRRLRPCARRTCAPSSPAAAPPASAMRARRANCRRCAASSPSPPPKPGGTAAVPRLKGPKKARSVPRPISPDEAVALAEEAADEAAEPWLAARDLAVLLLLYGSGLRVAEALGLTGAALPLGETLIVTGKRNKTRIVPLLPQVREAMEDYLAHLPLARRARRTLVQGRARRPVAGRDRPARGDEGAADPGPLRAHHAARSASQLRHPFARPRRGPARASGIARPCQPVARRKSTPQSMPRIDGRLSERAPQRLGARQIGAEGGTISRSTPIKAKTHLVEWSGYGYPTLDRMDNCSPHTAGDFCAR